MPPGSRNHHAADGFAGRTDGPPPGGTAKPAAPPASAPPASETAALRLAVRERVGPAKAARWFGPQTELSLGPEGVLVRAATPYLLKFVLSNYRSVIAEAAAEVTGRPLPVDGTVDGSLGGSPAELPEPLVVPAEPVPDEADARPAFDLTDFVVGDCNRLGYHAATQFVDDPGLAFGPLMLVGPVGCGKTHLLSGLAAAVRARGRRRVTTMTSVEFCNLFKQSMIENQTSTFRGRFNNTDVLCLDDVDFFDATRAFQTELLQTIERLEARGTRLVMTCGVNPQTLTRLSEELVSRLLSGVVCRVERPSQPVRRRVATSHAARMGSDLSAEAIRHAADRSEGSVRRVMGAVQTLDAEARMLGKKVGVAHARTVLARLHEGSRKVVKLADIESAVGRLFGVSSEELRSKARVRRVARPRHIAMALARRLTSAAYQEIGGHFGGRNHSTVMAAEKSVARLLEESQTLRVGCRELPACDVLQQLESELRAG